MRNIKVTVELAVSVNGKPLVIADLGPYNTVLSAAAAAEVVRGRTLKNLNEDWFTPGVSDYLKIRPEFIASEWSSHPIEYATARLEDGGVFLSEFPMFRQAAPPTTEIPIINLSPEPGSVPPPV